MNQKKKTIFLLLCLCIPSLFIVGMNITRMRKYPARRFRSENQRTTTLLTNNKKKEHLAYFFAIAKKIAAQKVHNKPIKGIPKASGISSTKNVVVLFKKELQTLDDQKWFKTLERLQRIVFQEYAELNISWWRSLFGMGPDVSEEAFEKWIKDVFYQGNEQAYHEWLILKEQAYNTIEAQPIFLQERNKKELYEKE